ncbi:MAG: restriction endonuclease subunit S [Candidatus Ancillula sp.]|jgi:type I restriction enzyme S subunit|nr:restriction endonuclease subunit S [Candidatus Ancillula sp.]
MARPANRKGTKSDALRKSILQQAVEGKLTGADTSKWVETKLGECVDFSLGKTPPRKESIYWTSPIYPWVSISDLKDGETIHTTKEQVNQYSADNLYRKLPSPAGTLLMSFKLTIGKVSILGMDAYHNEAIISIFPTASVSRDWIFHVLPFISTDGDTKNAIMGKTLNSSSIKSIPIHLPPLPTQHRIVAKIDQLFSQLDRLETK